MPTYRALELGKSIALANKETMVVAGELMMRKSREKKVEILPVDSEHNAIHQCLRGGQQKEVARLILTASGRAFPGNSQGKNVGGNARPGTQPSDVEYGQKDNDRFRHIDEQGARGDRSVRLFEVAAEVIHVVVHPQSVVHSMVEFIDGSVLAQLGLTDMRIAIQYALTYPERWEFASSLSGYLSVTQD